MSYKFTLPIPGLSARDTHFIMVLFYCISVQCAGHKINLWSLFGASLVAQMVKNAPAMRVTWVRFLGWEDPLEMGMATYSSILAWRIPWTEEPGRLQSMGSQRVRRDWGTFTYLLTVKLPSKVILCLPVYFLGNVTEMSKSMFLFACLSDYSFCNCPHNLEFY